MPKRKLWIILSALPTLTAILLSNAVFIEQRATDLITLSSLAFTAGSVAFGICWSATAGIVEQAFTTERIAPRRYLARGLAEAVLVVLAISWLYLVFDVALDHADEKLRPAALLAAYAITTGWWVLQHVSGSNEPCAQQYLFAFLIAAAAVTATLWITRLPLGVSLLPGAAVIAYVGFQRVAIR